jgi:hypothetical protein
LFYFCTVQFEFIMVFQVFNFIFILLFGFWILKVDLDLGNYERFLDVTLTKDNNITTGKIYQVHACFNCYYVINW